LGAFIGGFWVPFSLPAGAFRGYAGPKRHPHLHMPFWFISMPKKSDDEWLPDSRGRYVRKVGWWINESGERKQYPFKFGTTSDKAKARLLRVRELWSHVEEQSGQSKPASFPYNLTESPLKLPTWNGESLWIARELAAGRVQIVVEPCDTQSQQSYALRIHELGRRYPFVVFVPSEEQAHENGSDFLERAAEHRLKEVAKLSPNVLPKLTGTFHAALDEYASFVAENYVEPTQAGPTRTPFSVHIRSNIKMLKVRQPDVPLSTLDLDGCQRLLDFWRMRPLTTDKRIDPPRPMAKETCENFVAELMRFFRWLHRSKKFDWRKPEDFDDLKTTVKDFSEERTEVSHFTERKAYLPTELAMLNKYATPLERLLLLLGLNCGMKGAEQGTLSISHLFLDRPHPNAAYLKQVAKFDCQPEDRFVIYSRNKTKVYGEFLLWSQTIEVLRWAVERRRRIADAHGVTSTNLLITEAGTFFHRLTSGEKNRSQLFTNKWSALIDRVKRDHPDFPAFPFSTLRDSASDLIRQIAGGEVASVFLMHGKPVKQDNLLDLYTKRPFGRVFEALRQLQSDALKGVFESAPAAVTAQPMQQYTSMSKRERMLELKAQNKTPTEIAEDVGVSIATVKRTLTRLWFKGKH
jgi:DNA-binding CsgD family transcriptional regulator